MTEHTYMLRQNLADIDSYAGSMLADLERGAGELPQWTNHIISTVRTHMHDVVHFLRHQAKEGRRYGVPGIPYPQPGWWGQGGVATADSPFLAGERRYGIEVVRGPQSGPAVRSSRVYAGRMEAASMTRKNLREIAEYAREAAGHLEHGAGIAPAWVEHKLSIAACRMDGMGHWLENEGVEGRKYGGGRDRRDARRGAGSGHIPHPQRRGRFWKKHPHRHVPFHPDWGYVPWMHPGNGIDHRTGFQSDIHLGEPWPVPHVAKVYAHMVRRQLLPEIPDSHAVLGMIGSGFSAIDAPSMRIRYRLNGEWRDDDALILEHTDDRLEIALPISKQVVHDFELGDIGYYEDGALESIAHSFFQAVRRPYHPFATLDYGRAFEPRSISSDDASNVRKYALNLAQKFEGPPGPIRPRSQAGGIRRYAMTPDEYVDMVGPMGYLQRPWRNLRVGYGPVQEYGSMGYGSMGDGSMSMAVQQAMLQRARKARLP